MTATSEQVVDATSAIDAALDTLVAADLDALGSVSLTRLVRSIARIETRLAGVTARAVSAADRTDAIAGAGASSVVTWLADATGSAPGSASRAASLARAIDASPAIADGVADGSLAADSARTLARAIDRGVLPTAAVDDLVDDARSLPAGVFAREVRAREARADNARLRRDETWARTRRSFTTRRREDGSVEGRFLVDPLAGETVVTAIRSLATLDPADTPLEERRTREQRDADAFVAITRHALDGGAGGDQLNVRPHVSVVVPVAALDPDGDRAAAAGAVGATADGAPLSVEAVRSLLCDAAVRRIVVDPAGMPLDVGRATRTWSGAQRAASAAVDGGCRGPACDRPFGWTALHHVDWWSQGGHTDLARGIPLCHHCHHLVHDDGWTVEMAADTRIATWTSPAGRVSTTHPRGPAAPGRLTDPAASAELAVTEQPALGQPSATAAPPARTDAPGPDRPPDAPRPDRPPDAPRPDRPPDAPDADVPDPPRSHDDPGDSPTHDRDGPPNDHPGDPRHEQPHLVDAIALELLTPV